MFKNIANRSLNVDVVRVSAMLMVIVLHTFLNFTLRPDFFGTKVWFAFEPIVAISKTCVLLFFMLSGYLVLNKSRSLKDNWQKIKSRLLIPLLFFSAINLAYAFYKFPVTGSNWGAFIESQLVRMTDFPSSPLWFLGVLTILYALNPLLQTLFAADKKADVALYVQNGALVFTLLASFIMYLTHQSDSFFNSFTGWLGYIFFYVYGGSVRNKWVSIHNQKLNVFLVVAGLAGTMAGDYFTGLVTQGAFESRWAGYTTQYLSLPVVMMAVGLFNILMSFDFDRLKQRAVGAKVVLGIEWLAGVSFGIYLIHTFVISALNDLTGFNFNSLGINVYLYNLLNYGIVFGISLILTYLLQKTPKLKSIIGG